MIDKLPYDIIETILKNIDDTKELIKLRGVNKIFNKVINDNKLISLKMPDYNYKLEYLGVLELYNLNTNVENIKNIIIKNDKLENVEKFKNCRRLTISHCNKITDISPLKNIHHLTLRHCHKITDISPLKNVHTLDLFDCDNITNIPYLKMYIT